MTLFLKTVIISILCISSVAQVDKIQQDFNKLQAGKEQVTPIRHKPTDHYVQDCGADARLPIKHSTASLLQSNNVPGAGITKFQPFQKVLKDGFAFTKCVKDYMYYRGDKFGDNKHDYKLGPVSNVSIVHYDAFVAKEDRAEMTQKKCFEFCRTVPNMGFFGIVNGRGCYCMPYFTPMESDSSKCDAVCEGDKTLTCGGKSKSSVFTMHMCASTEEDLYKRIHSAENLVWFMYESVGFSHHLSDEMQTMGEHLQKVFGAVGDSGAAGLMQKAKQFAGDLVHKAEDTDAVANSLDEVVSKGHSLSDFTKPDTVTSAERVMEGIDKFMAEGDDIAAELRELEGLAVGNPAPSDLHVKASSDHDEKSGPAPTAKGFEIKYEKSGHIIAGPNHMFGYLGDYYNTPETFEECARKVSGEAMCSNIFHYDKGDGECRCATGLPVEYHESHPHWSTYNLKKDEKYVAPSEQYYPVMYFVDKKFENVPTTCSGDLVAKPIVNQSPDVCAASCDGNIHSCVGFQYFKDGDMSLCFLFSSFSTGFYYTGCGKSFLQSGTASADAKCYAKLSKFSGTTLKPNPSGKCKQCFKELTKADRCY